jgi:NADH-quinone oxidoreductase subunit G
MPKLTIDGKEIEVENGTLLIQAAERLGIEIPRFCYHERLAVAGNCRMCLVEVSPGPPKPQASCALPCADNMVVKTNSPMVKKAREGVMEFLLINHPLDCPICDQGGECDLQDQALLYGSGTSRYKDHKRAVEDKYMGPLIKTHMTRCIQCTRCVRFATDIAGVPELGAFGRGEHMEIGTYVEKTITSELSGNLVDVCPVGALTSRPYAFAARPWELKKTESIDVLDAVGSNIRVDSRGEAVLRILPRVHEDINEEWISDKTRHACDGLRSQRLDRPYVRGKDGKLREATWDEALLIVAEYMKGMSPHDMAFIAGNLADCESIMALKDLGDSLGVTNRDCRQEGALIDNSERANYLFNATIAGIEKADAIVLIGANPRKEAALLNARIRKRFLKGGLTVYNLGVEADLTYPVTQLGTDARKIADIAAMLKDAKSPLIIVGPSALARVDGPAIFAAAKKLAQSLPGENVFNVLQHAASRVGALDLGFVPPAGGKNIAQIFEAAGRGEIKFAYLLGADEFDMSLLGKAFVVYQGHHGDDGAHRADVVLPGAAYTEKEATYVNLEGRVQRTKRAIFPPGAAREDWAIIRMLSDVIGKPLPYSSLTDVRARMIRQAPHFANINQISIEAPLKKAEAAGTISDAPLEPFINNFYMTDPISRASRTMAEYTKNIAAPNAKKVA